LQVDDFVAYWTAGRLNATGNNPYDPAKIIPLQKEVGRFNGVPVFMWNPPWTLTFIMPFGILNYSLSRLLWLILHVVLVFFSADMSWRLYGGPPRYIWIAWIVAFTFSPTLFVLSVGQSSSMIFAGVIGFLIFIQRRQYWLSGTTLVLITVKPQLLYAFLIVLFLWTIEQRHWSILLSCGMSLLVATGIPLINNPALLGQYLDLIVNYAPVYWQVPTLGGAIRFLLKIKNFWVQCIPTALGIIWAVLYWIRRRSTWVWLEEIPLLLLVSLVTSVYAWTYDQVVLVVVVVQVVIALLNKGEWQTAIMVLIPYFIINVLALVLRGSFHDFWFMWLSPAMLLWYLTIRWKSGIKLHLSKEAL
jgi:hypothetical protein